jgi:hypothetical protein
MEVPASESFEQLSLWHFLSFLRSSYLFKKKKKMKMIDFQKKKKKNSYL